MTFILPKIILNRRSMSECLKLFDTKTKTIKICFSFLFFLSFCVYGTCRLKKFALQI